MRFAPVLTLALLLAAPASAQSGHDGNPRPRTGPEASDAALFVAAAGAVWFTRRALRRRLPRKD